jgi:hypothetical protein
MVERPELQALPTAIVAPPLERPPPRSESPRSSPSVQVSELTPLAEHATQMLAPVVEPVAPVAPVVEPLPPAPDPMALADDPMTPIDRGSTSPRLFPPETGGLDRRKWILGAASAAGVLAIGLLVMALWPAAPPMAILDITLDKQAVVAVDGKPEAPTKRAIVKVKPGVAHVVTVEHAGKIVRTVNVPSMAPNEELQLNVIVR